MPDNNDELNIVDEEGDIIGVETREMIHKQGFLHRVVNIFFFTPQGDIIFQHRAKDKDTYPDLLDSTVGGHVEIGMDYDSTAVQEIKEETGLTVAKEKLIFIQKLHSNQYDVLTGKINNDLKAYYAYRYDGRVENLQVEAGKAIGFEAWPIEKLFTLSEEDKRRFVPAALSDEVLEMYRKIQLLV